MCVLTENELLLFYIIVSCVGVTYYLWLNLVTATRIVLKTDLEILASNKTDSEMKTENNQPVKEGLNKSGAADLEDFDQDDDYESLNTQLDQLNSVLDLLEQKNENIQAQLMELLKSNQETRKFFQENNFSETKP